MNQSPAARINGSINININCSCAQSDTSIAEAHAFGTFLVEIRQVFTETDRTVFLEQFIGYRGALELLQVQQEVSDPLYSFCSYAKARDLSHFSLFFTPIFHTFFILDFLETFRIRRSFQANEFSREINPPENNVGR